MLDLEDWQNKKYQTRDGRSMRLLCVDAPGPCPIKGIDKEGYLMEWASGGYNIASSRLWDLINAPPEPVTITRWVNVYSVPKDETFAFGDLHRTEEHAKKCTGGGNCVATVPVTITFTPNGR